MNLSDQRAVSHDSRCSPILTFSLPTMCCPGKRRQAVLSQNPVVNLDALIKRRKAEEVIQAIHPRWISCDRHTIARDADIDRRGVAAGMLQRGLLDPEVFTRGRI